MTINLGKILFCVFATLFCSMESRLVWIALDGFRPDYLNPETTPNLYKLSQRAVVSQKHKPVFSTKSFPNLFSAATGLYPDKTGILNNKMYSKERKEFFDKNNTDPVWWNQKISTQSNNRKKDDKTSSIDNKNQDDKTQSINNNQDDETQSISMNSDGETQSISMNSDGETQTIPVNSDDTTVPIWILNQQIGPGNSAVIHWPGSQVLYNGKVPDFYLDKYTHYTGDTPERLNIGYEQINSFTNNLVMIFLEDVDDAAHKYGTTHPEMKRILTEMDASIGVFMEVLEESGVDNQIDFMVSSDHGMVDVPTTNVFDLKEILENAKIDTSNLTVVNTGAVFEVSTNRTNAELIKKALTNENYIDQVYLDDELPQHLHYSHPDRTPTLVAICKAGHAVIWGGSYDKKAEHGYPFESTNEMQAFFMAFGPSIDETAELTETTQPDLFLIACHLLKIGDENCGHSDGHLPNHIFVVHDKKRKLDYKLILILPGVLLLIPLVYFGHKFIKRVLASRANYNSVEKDPILV